MGIYLSPIFASILNQYKDEFGYITTQNSGTITQAIRGGYYWMLDNGCFYDGFNLDNWRGALNRYVEYRERCIGVIIPDVLRKQPDGSVIGDCAATIKQLYKYRPIAHDLGYRIGFVSQDGLVPEITPWDDFDVLFVGGSDKHKFTESWALIDEAIRRKKWVHIGRVNSASRIRLFWKANSWDGTCLARNGSVNMQREIIGATRWASSMKLKEQGGLF